MGNMGSPTLSFIIPVYNSENTLEECVQSILSQKTDNIEIILVDDGSKDVCAKLCDKLAEKNPQSVKTIHKPNGGSLSARLEGVRYATGKYILYVDADDIVLDGAIFHIMQDIVSGADMYIYDYLMDCVGGENTMRIHVVESEDNVIFSHDKKIDLARVFMKGMINTVCAAAFKKSLLEKTDFPLLTNKIKHGEDRLQKMFLIESASSIVYVPYAFYHYRWFAGTQGDDLRIGHFSYEILADFRTTWSIEREHYNALGFNEEEARMYDARKITRICTLLEKSYTERNLDAVEIRSFVERVTDDSLFVSLSNENVLSKCGLHIKIVSRMIKENKPRCLMVYWTMCKMIRSIKYGRNK